MIFTIRARVGNSSDADRLIAANEQEIYVFGSPLSANHLVKIAVAAARYSLGLAVAV